MKDIENRSDIERLVDKFYGQILSDDLIGIFFTEVVKLDQKIHIPIMYDFWETALLGKVNYKGNPMLKHIQLNDKKKLEPEHFERWLFFWENTIRENFTGPIAEEAINKAKSIGELMKFKISQKL